MICMYDHVSLFASQKQFKLLKKKKKRLAGIKTVLVLLALQLFVPQKTARIPL